MSGIILTTSEHPIARIALYDDVTDAIENQAPRDVYIYAAASEDREALVQVMQVAYKSAYLSSATVGAINRLCLLAGIGAREVDKGR